MLPPPFPFTAPPLAAAAAAVPEPEVDRVCDVCADVIEDVYAAADEDVVTVMNVACDEDEDESESERRVERGRGRVWVWVWV